MESHSLALIVRYLTDTYLQGTASVWDCLGSVSIANRLASCYTQSSFKHVSPIDLTLLTMYPYILGLRNLGNDLSVGPLSCTTV